MQNGSFNREALIRNLPAVAQLDEDKHQNTYIGRYVPHCHNGSSRKPHAIEQSDIVEAHWLHRVALPSFARTHHSFIHSQQVKGRIFAAMQPSTSGNHAERKSTPFSYSRGEGEEGKNSQSSPTTIAADREGRSVRNRDWFSRSLEPREDVGMLRELKRGSGEKKIVALLEN